MKKEGLIKSILATVFAGLIFVGFAFNFVFLHSTAGGKSVLWSFADWNKFLQSGLDLAKVGADTSEYALWQISRILMIVVLVILVIALATAFVKVWINHRAVSMLLKVASVVALVLSIAFLLTVVGGGFTLGNYTATVREFYLPHVAPIWMSVFAIISSSLLISFGDKKKKGCAEQESFAVNAEAEQAEPTEHQSEPAAEQGKAELEAEQTETKKPATDKKPAEPAKATKSVSKRANANNKKNKRKN